MKYPCSGFAFQVYVNPMNCVMYLFDIITICSTLLPRPNIQGLRVGQWTLKSRLMQKQHKSLPGEN